MGYTPDKKYDPCKDCHPGATCDNCTIGEDKARLDYLDCLNDKLNQRSMSDYGWELNINHNRVSLHDSSIPSISVREAIDAHMEKARNRK